MIGQASERIQGIVLEYNKPSPIQKTICNFRDCLFALLLGNVV
jgi:hypothetical protein